MIGIQVAGGFMDPMEPMEQDPVADSMSESVDSSPLSDSQFVELTPLARSQLRFQWIVVTLLSWTIVNAGFVIFSIPKPFFMFSWLVAVVLEPIGQWLVLRRFIPVGKRWLFSGFIWGYSSFYFMNEYGLSQLFESQFWLKYPQIMLLYIILFLGSLGFFQWLVLRQRIPSSRSWIGFSAASIMASLLVETMLFLYVKELSHKRVGIIIIGTFAGSASSLITGSGLYWLLRQPLKPVIQKI